MKPPPFEYDRVTSVEECVALLAEHGDEAKVIAGGQSLMPLLSFRLSRPSRVIDINALPLVDVASEDGLAFGALTRHRVVERSAAARAANPLVADAVRFIGHSAIRNRGTVGGSIAHADPAAELPTVLTALGGHVEAVSGRGTRRIAADDLFTGFLTSSVAPDELLTRVYVPVLPAGVGWAFHEFARRSGDFAIVGVAATVEVDAAGRISDARLAFSGVGSTPVRAVDVEGKLRGEVPTPELWGDAARSAAKSLEPGTDLHGTAAYRRHLAAVLAERALSEADARRGETR